MTISSFKIRVKSLSVKILKWNVRQAPATDYLEIYAACYYLSGSLMVSQGAARVSDEVLLLKLQSL